MAEPAKPTDRELADVIVATVAQFVRKDVVPVAGELERHDTYPAELVATMADLGLFACAVPEEFGGLELDTVTYARVIEELSAGWMSLSGVLNTHTMVVKLLVRHGTREQQEHFLPAMATGTPRGALSLSEPDAGSDTNAISCKAVRDGDEFVV
jgi:alkylation response protein AidB-like acyl-CoA dehydrogenase